MQPNWFIAWPLAPGDWFQALVATAPPALRRFHPDDLHVTLAFLGPVDEALARAAWAVVLTLPPEATTGTLGRVAAFGNPRKPSAFSVEIASPVLREAIGGLRDLVCEAAGVAPDDRPPRAHATVVRPRREATEAERAAGIAWARSVAPLERQARFDRVALYTWSADRGERLFAKVEELAL